MRATRRNVNGFNLNSHARRHFLEVFNLNRVSLSNLGKTRKRKTGFNLNLPPARLRRRVTLIFLLFTGICPLSTTKMSRRQLFTRRLIAISVTRHRVIGAKAHRRHRQRHRPPTHQRGAFNPMTNNVSRNVNRRGTKGLEVRAAGFPL